MGSDLVACDDCFCRVPDVAEWVSVEPRTVRRWIDEGTVEPAFAGRRYWVVCKESLLDCSETGFLRGADLSPGTMVPGDNFGQV
jgi:hypothetical protein